MRRPSELRLRSAAVLLALAAHACAQAQVSGSVALVSDYQYHGVSLSQGAPVPQLTVVYDNPAGWYVAAFASRIRVLYVPRADVKYAAHAGYARRLASGLSWEAGVSTNTYPDWSSRNYREVFGGLAGERVNGRLSYAPNYLGLDVATLYAEVNASHPLRGNLSLFGHLGYMASLGGGEASVRRADGRVGLGLNVQAWQFQLAVTGAQRRRAALQPYEAPGRQARTVVLNVVRRF
jgi:uncharacterized protein (TIGR02001 family)